ncbi:hypothetical protein CPB85DRAFT_1565906 [Mucidula mucida]|nr:hypothetical protein CPB85DRAFT_1565906 [Mucidula mucida]
MSTLRRQDRMAVILPPPPPQPQLASDQGLGIQKQPAPLTRQPTMALAQPPTRPQHQQIQPSNVRAQPPLQRRDTSPVSLVPLRRRSRFATLPRREGALYGEADFQRLRIPRPLRRTYAFWKHLPLLSARPLRRENAFYGESMLGLPLAAPTRRGVKQGVKFLRRPAGPSAKAAVLGQPKSILKKPRSVEGSLQLVQDGPVARTWGKFRYFPNVGSLEHWVTTGRWVDLEKSNMHGLVCKGCSRTVALDGTNSPPKRMQIWKMHKKRCSGIWKTEYHERNDLFFRNDPTI